MFKEHLKEKCQVYKLIIFAPAAEKEKIKNAMFELGAGQLGDYDSCCFETPGNGQFRPLKNSDPFIGERGKVEIVQEVKIEMICPQSLIKDAIQELRRVHPYEEPAFDIIKLEQIK